MTSISTEQTIFQIVGAILFALLITTIYIAFFLRKLTEEERKQQKINQQTIEFTSDLFKQGINLRKLSHAWIKINNKYIQIFAIQVAYEDKLKQPIIVINYFFKLTKEEFINLFKSIKYEH